VYGDVGPLHLALLGELPQDLATGCCVSWSLHAQRWLSCTHRVGCSSRLTGLVLLRQIPLRQIPLRQILQHFFVLAESFGLFYLGSLHA
jgi:hypothetical protein